MEKGKTAQPQIGTWEKLPTERMERKPKVEFDINVPKTVVFTSVAPKEFMGDTGAYYVFDVEENKVQKVIVTSAWSLLRELKINAPLLGNSFTITKKLEKGKQRFEVKKN